MMEAEPMELATEPTSPVMETKKKKSLLGRLRKSRKSKSSKNQQSEPQDAPPASLAGEEEVLPAVASAESRNGEVSVSGSSGSDADDANAAAAAAMSNARTEREAELAAKSVARDGNPVITSVNADQFQPSDVRDEDIPSTEVSPTSQELSQVAASSSSSPAKSPDSAKSSRRGRRQMIVLDRAPTAKESAFGGPPKYDWIDIETAAAVKVQAAFRRNKAMAELEAQGMSTAVMRNRHRARGAKGTGRAFHSDDAPGMLACCGVGFLFGDATGEDEKILAAERRKEYKEKKKQMEEDEKQKRKFRYRKKASDHIDEEFEVVDS